MEKEEIKDLNYRIMNFLAKRRHPVSCIEALSIESKDAADAISQEVYEMPLQKKIKLGKRI